MNINSTSNNKKEVEDVSTRVKNTKKEIEQLKTELEKLINSGTQASINNLLSENKPTLETSQFSENKTCDKIKSPIKTTERQIPKNVTQHETKCPSKKTRNYDVNEARNYIKKQREKRAEQLRAQINVTDNKLDLKKQKLRDLQKKSLELVTKNVQLKRERSKSREKVTQIRIDKTNIRSKSLETIKNENCCVKSQDRQKQPPARAKSQEKKKSEHDERLARSRARQTSVTTESQQIKSNIKLIENDVKKSVDILQETESKNLNEEISSNSFTEFIKNVPEVREPKIVLEHSIMTDACVKDTKETQTSRTNFEGETWLQPPSVLPYPYNFINTVKRKLQYAINSPRSFVDVGIQNSEENTEHTPETEKTKSKEEIKELLIKSANTELKSFVSHKCLDLKAVENLELIPNKTHSKSNKEVSKNLFNNYDSESDTSKNIPEISSESLILVDKPQLNFDKLKKIKLQNIKKSSQSESYSSDFYKDETAPSAKSKSEDSTIKTIASDERIISDLIYSISVNDNKTPTFIDSKIEQSENFNAATNDELTSFKPLSTERQLLKKLSDSLTLKKPSVSLSTRDLNSENNEVNTITTRTENSSTENKSESRCTVNSLKIVDSTCSKTVTGDHKSLCLKGSDFLVSGKKEQNKSEAMKNQLKNITVRPTTSSKNNVNEIHLKFEAEVRLLNDFNESFKQFMAVEKAFENIKNKSETNISLRKVLQNADTQTSVVTTQKTSSNETNKSPTINTNTINFSRGSEIVEELNGSITNSKSKSLQNSSFSTEWNFSNLNESSNLSMVEEEQTKFSIFNIENCSVNNCASLLSLNIFDQLIKDEDTRIQQLKAIIKIREQALLDRTKGELVWLEIQKKQLIETGKIEEASLLKKKQRGIILKHEQERNEIKKLKQMQKEASEKRKNTLKQQRNLIKTRLSTDNMLSQMTVKKRKERRSTGPLRVVQSCSESINSETSISLKSSGLEDVLSITSRSLRVSEESQLDVSQEKVPVSNAKRTLLMREAALQKRRKAAEELLKWHRKLLDEERKIAELEAAATSVIRKQRREAPDKYKFNGKQLNQLWKNMTGGDEKKFVDEKIYIMSQIALERFCKSARQYSSKNKKTAMKNSEFSTENSGVCEGEKSVKKSSDDVNYSSMFEAESVQEIISSQEEKTKISSISELIDNFSKIEDEISSLSKKSKNIISLKEGKSGQEIESVEECKELEDLTEKEISFNDDSQIMLHNEDISTIEDQEGSVCEVATEKLSEIKQIFTQSDDQEISSIIETEPTELKSSKTDHLEVLSTLNESVKETVNYIEEAFNENTEVFKPSSKEKLLHEESHTEETSSIIIKDVEELEPSSSTPDKSTSNSTNIVDDVSKEDQIVRTEESFSKVDDIKGFNLSSVDESIKLTEESFAATKDDKIENVEEYLNNETKHSTEEYLKEELPDKSHTDTIDSLKPIKENSSTTSEILTISTESKEFGKESLGLEEALECASKIEESLNELNKKLISDNDVSSKSQTTSPTSLTIDESTPQKKTSNQIDVKKRVSEILADVSLTRGDKSPRLQDLYITAYDVGASNLPEFTETFEDGRQLPTDIFGSEAEELWRKQLAIEQEIKQLELQQKEQLPYVLIREIPNKPPPPYTPPSSLSSLPLSIIPSDVKEICEIASYSSKVLFKANQNNSLDKVKFSENGFKLFSKIDVSKICAEFVFNICRDIARDHYNQFKIIEEPSWLTLAKKPQLAKTKPSNAVGLEKILNIKLKELFGFKKVQVAESAIIKWGRKKRDHVDEVLVLESQEEESQWTNFDKDELIVKNQITVDIMKMLLEETTDVFAKILFKKKAILQ